MKLFTQTFKSAPLLAHALRDTKRFEEDNPLQDLVADDPKALGSQLAALDNLQRAADALGVQPDEHWIAPACGEQPAVDLYVYRPKHCAQSALGLAPVLYFLHCGGYLLGHAREYSDHLFQLANEHHAILISAEYRTARIAPYPADLNDAYHGLQYLYDHATDLGLDAKRFVLFGESAGGGLAARLALKVRDVGKMALAGQVLIYPMLDARTGSPDYPPAPNTGEFYWNAPLNQLGWQTLRANQTIPTAEQGYFSAALAQDLSALPRTFLMCGALDLFAAESLDYARRLHGAGVVVDMVLISGVYHAFEYVAPESEQSALYTQARCLAVSQMMLG